MKRIQLLDYGRFFAAMAVVLFHYFYAGIQEGKITSISYIPDVVDIVKYGYLGVAFFFMISGYVIFFSAKNRSASQFIVSRAVRLYPVFWVAIIFTSICALLWGGETMMVYPSMILANITMLAPAFDRGFVDVVYWTLVYELEFYALICLLLFLGFKHQLEAILLAWPFIIVIAFYFEKDHLPFLGNYFCYFSAGTILAMMKEKKTAFRYTSLLLILYLSLIFSIEKATSVSISKDIFYSYNLIVAIVITFYLFFILINSEVLSNVNLYGSRLLGGLTYPIYLIHAHFGYMMITQFSTEKNKLEIYILTISGVLFISYFIHVYVEKRYEQHWRKLFQLLAGKPVAYLNLKYTELATLKVK